MTITACFINRSILVVCIAALAGVVPAEAASDTLPTIQLSVSSSGVVFEDWESGQGFWSAENGVWAVGLPTYGPDSAFAGVSCAATNLSGTYPRHTASRLVSPYLAIPMSGSGGSVWLRFWHWFSVYDSNDLARVQIKRQGETTWTDISVAFAYTGGSWTVHRVNLAAYEGSNVQLGFLIDDDGSDTGYPNYSPTVAAGWYLDDLELVEIPESYWTAEDFEAGYGDWYAERGTWEVGVPSTGPSSTHQGTRSAGSQLIGNYPRNCNSRLVSPPLALNPSPVDGLIHLRFWHWFSVYNRSDLARVEVRPLGGAWIDVSVSFGYTCGGWTQHIVDISTFAGQTIEIGFRIDDDNGDTGYPNFSPTISSGWYIDDITIEEGSLLPWTSAAFENGIQDWYADGGIWQVGNPIYGPSDVKYGSACAATVLDGNYRLYCNSRLISPPVTLDAAPLDGALWLAFWHWFSIYNSGDVARVEIKPEGGAWEIISNSQKYTSGVWSRQILDIAAYAGQTVQFAFHIVDDGTNTGYPNFSWCVSAGWYVDEVHIFDGILEAHLPEHFEDTAWDHTPNRGDWSVEGGVWDIGVPTYGPSSYEGTMCAATKLDSKYDRHCQSRLISPEIDLDPSPMDGKLWLSFWHWYAIYSTGDVTRVEIRTPGGSWTALSQNFVYNSAHWTQCVLDLSTYTGQTIQLCWYIKDDGTDTGYPNFSPTISAGWYIDNIQIVDGALRSNHIEDFEDGSLGWVASASLWQIGEPSSGPGSAHSGDWCAATVLNGNYTYRCNSRLMSPPFVVPADGIARFWHWFTFYSGDSGRLEISVADGPWTEIHTFSNSSGSWTQYVIDLMAYVGQEVRIGFRLPDDGTGTGTISSGWYIDDFHVLNLPEGKPEAPDFFSADYSTDPPQLLWGNVPGDAQRVVLYAGLTEEFRPDISNRIALFTTQTSFTDDEHPGWSRHYKIAVIDSNGHESIHVGPQTITGTEEETPVCRTSLSQNFPNPFNPQTTISYGIAEDTKVNLSIYNVAGQLIKVLVDENQKANHYKITWDGRNDSGKQVSSGIYFCRLKTNKFEKTKKLVLLR